MPKEKSTFSFQRFNICHFYNEKMNENERLGTQQSTTNTSIQQ